MNQNDEDISIKNRILLKDMNIKKLTMKCLDLLSRFNSLTRNEMSQILHEILNEIDFIEISILKAENIQKLKALDKEHFKTLSNEIQKDIYDISSDIIDCNKQLNQAKEEKDYKIHCEEISKIVNGYDTQECFNEQITALEMENDLIKSKTEFIYNQIHSKANKLSLLVSLVNELQKNIEKDDEEYRKINQLNE